MKKEELEAVYFTPRELATMWKMHHRTLGNWRRKGRGPVYLKLDGRILYPADAITKWESQRLQTGDKKMYSRKQ